MVSTQRLCLLLGSKKVSQCFSKYQLVSVFPSLADSMFLPASSKFTTHQLHKSSGKESCLAVVAKSCSSELELLKVKITQKMVLTSFSCYLLLQIFLLFFTD